MDPATLEALKGSIAKWESIARGEGEDLGPDNCALCRKFATGPLFSDYCSGCPVYNYTCVRACKHTPYEQWEDHWDELDPLGNEPRVATTPTQVALAQAEVDFLKSLLPKDTNGSV